MPYFAAVLSRSAGRWSSSEVDLDDAEDLDDVADVIREEAQGASPALLFVEENDEWFGIVRVDGDDDPEVFLSDGAAIEISDTAQVVFGGATKDGSARGGDGDGDPDDDTEADADQAIGATAVPAGNADLLADLELSGADLLALCDAKAQLPIDVIAAVWERLGAGDQIEALR